MNTEYYDILGLEPDCTIDEIKVAYRKMSMKYHPDVNKDEFAKEQFILINKAYKILSDPIKRLKYDENGITEEVSRDKEIGHFMSTVIIPRLIMEEEGIFERHNPLNVIYEVLRNVVHEVKKQQVSFEAEKKKLTLFITKLKLKQNKEPNIALELSFSARINFLNTNIDILINHLEMVKIIKESFENYQYETDSNAKTTFRISGTFNGVPYS